MKKKLEFIGGAFLGLLMMGGLVVALISALMWRTANPSYFPTWAYYVGMVGGSILFIGIFLFILHDIHSSPSAETSSNGATTKS